MIPFDIKLRPEIEDGTCVVMTRDYKPVRIVCWDASEEHPIAALVEVNDNGHKKLATGLYTAQGKYCPADSPYDLFIAIAGKKLNDFENGLFKMMKAFDRWNTDPKYKPYYLELWVRRNAKTLRWLATHDDFKKENLKHR